MRGTRLWLGAALVALVASSGCCRWWCHNCERCTGHAPAAAPVPVASGACVPCAPVCCQPVQPCCQPVQPCCPPGTMPAGAIPAGAIPAGAAVAPQGWR